MTVQTQLGEHVNPIASLDAGDATASGNGSGVDTRGYGEAAVVVSVGAVSGTAPTLDIKLQESDDDVTYADVAGAAFAQMTASDANSVKKGSVDLSQRKRYLRLVRTIAGTSPSFGLSGMIVLSKGRALPAPASAWMV